MMENFPYMKEGCLLDIADIPETYKYFQLTRIIEIVSVVQFPNVIQQSKT